MRKSGGKALEQEKKKTAGAGRGQRTGQKYDFKFAGK